MLVLMLLLIVPLIAVAVRFDAADDRSSRQPADVLPRLRHHNPARRDRWAGPTSWSWSPTTSVESLAGMTHVQDLLVSRGTTYDDAMVPIRDVLPVPRRAAHRPLLRIRPKFGRHPGPSAAGVGTTRTATMCTPSRWRSTTRATGQRWSASTSTRSPTGAGGLPAPGLDVFTAFTTTNRSGNYYDYSLSDGTVHGSGPDDYSTDVLAARAVEFVRTTPASTRLFLYLAPYAPHAHFRPAPRHLGAWKGRLPRFDSPAIGEDVSDKPLWVQQLDPVRPARVRHVQRAQQESLMAVD